MRYKVQTDAEQDEATVTQLKGEWELHLCKAERAYQQVKEDTALSKCDPNVMLVTFNLEQSPSVIHVAAKTAMFIC